MDSENSSDSSDSEVKFIVFSRELTVQYQVRKLPEGDFFAAAKRLLLLQRLLQNSR